MNSFELRSKVIGKSSDINFNSFVRKSFFNVSFKCSCEANAKVTINWIRDKFVKDIVIGIDSFQHSMNEWLVPFHPQML